MKPYYYIHRIGASNVDVDIFKDLKSADKHAKELSAKYPSNSFEVLQVISITKTTTPQTFWVDGAVPPCNCESNQNTYACCCN